MSRRRPRASGSQPAAFPRPPTARDYNAWQVYACAALATLGATAGLLRANERLSDYLDSARAALAVCGVPLCIGVWAGLVGARRIIRHRLSPTASANQIDLHSAPTLTAALLLAAALAWVLVGALAANLTNFQTWFAQTFVHPPWLTRGLSLAPISLSFVLLAGAATAAIVALLRWQRVLRPHDSHVLRLWLVILAAAAAGAGLAGGATRARVLDAAALLCAFAAPLIAAMRPPVAQRRDAGPRKSRRA